MDLTKTLFWDIDTKTLDLEQHKRFIIERVLTRGDFSDWVAIRNYYGVETIKNEALQIRSLDELTLNFCSRFFHLPEKQFRCYTEQPFMMIPSSY